jgi:uncharacterized protein (TIGR03435 family)
LKPGELSTMLQTFLADRLQLKYHREKRELPAYELVVGRDGSKLAKSADDAGALPGFSSGRGHLTVKNSTMNGLADYLQRRVVDRAVVDHTGLAGKFDFKLDWTPFDVQPGADSPPDIFTAIQQQLGLKLNAVKTPVDVFVVDHVERPSDN